MGSPNHASNREAPSASREPQIRSAPGVSLSPAQSGLLARVVGDSGSVFVKREFRSGYSGAVVMLVSTGAGEAPVVVKFAHPLDLQQEYHAYQRYVVRASPQNVAHLRGEPLITDDGQLGLLQYTFAGGESHQPTTNLLDYYTTYGGEAVASVLNRIFRVYGRHWWGNNRPEVYTLGEHYDRLLPVHLDVADTGADDDVGQVIVANHVSVTELRTLRVGQHVRLLGFEIAKVRDNGRRVTLWAAPPAGEATASLRIRLESAAERNCRPGETLESVNAVVVSTRTDLLADAARSAMPTFVAEDEAFIAHLSGEAGQPTADALVNPIHKLSACLDRVVETKRSTVHGDINLQNVLVDPQTGFSWLIDFGETRPGPTLLDLQRLEVQVIIKLLPESVAQAGLEPGCLVDLMASLHADPLPTHCLHPGLWEPFAVLLTVRRLARHYLMDDLQWDEYYYGLSIALVGALKFDELSNLARSLALLGAATALRLVGEPVITATANQPGASGNGQGAEATSALSNDAARNAALQGWAASYLRRRFNVDPQVQVDGTLATPACPFPGMTPYSEKDRASFYGRDVEIRESVSRLRLYPFLAVIGSSGSGKSSLVFAGIVPALRDSPHFGRATLEVKSMRPGPAPLSALAALFDVGDEPQYSLAPLAMADGAGHLGLALDEGDVLLEPNQVDALYSPGTNGADRPSLYHAIVEQRERLPLLLIVDQFEELFHSSDREQALAFMQTLQQLIMLDRIFVVLTVRADFYADIMESPLWSEIRDHRLEVTALKGDKLREAIIQPAQQSGVDVEPALVERLLADAADEPGSLPFVQETMVLLWEHVENRRLPLTAYTRLAHDDGRSGLQMAMAYRADHAYQVLSTSERMLARRIFLRLVQFGEGRPDTRRQMSVDSLRASGDDAARFDKVLLHLVDQRLLILSMDDAAAPKADIAHEQLLRGWPLLHEWINQRRDAEQTRRRLEIKADEWVRLGKGEGGRLDEFALAEADHWLASPDAADLGVSVQLTQLVEKSRALVQAQQEAEEDHRQHMLAVQMEAEQERKQTALQKTVARQLRRRAGALLVALAAALLAVVAAVWLFRDARIARVAADEARRSEQTLHLAAESAIERASSPQLGFLMALEAANWLDPATQQPIPAAIHALRSQFDQWTFWRATLTGHQDRVLALAFGHDATQLFSSSVDGEVRAWMLGKDDDRAQSVANLQQAVDALAVHPSQPWLAVGTQEGAIHLLDMDKGYAEVRSWQAHDDESRVLDIVFSADGKTLASSGADGTIRLWPIETMPSSPQRIITIPNQDECWPPSECWVRALDISPDHRFLAAGAQNRRLYLWDLSAQADAAPLINERFAGNVRAVAFNHDNTWLAAGDESGWILLYQLPLQGAGEAGALQPYHRLKLPQLPNVYALVFHPTKDVLAIASHTGPVLTLPVGEAIGSPVTLGIIDAGLESVAYSPSGEFLATGSSDGSVRLWNSQPINREPATLPGHTGTVRAVAFRTVPVSSPNATPYMLLSAGEDESVRLWMPGASSEATQQFFEAGNEILAAAVSPDGRWIATGGRDGSVRLRAGEEVEAEPVLLGAHAGEIVAVTFSPDSAFLATGGADRRIFLWDLENRSAAPQVLESREAGILGLAYNTDGSLLASGDESGQVKLWDLTQSPPTGRMLFRHDNWVRSVAFSPNGEYVASASDDGTIRLSALVDGVTDQGPVPAHEPRARTIVFAPSGAPLASAGDDGSVKLWNPLNLQEEPVVLRQHVGAVRALAFSADGKSLASAGDDTVIRVWTVYLDDLRQMACERVARNFSEAEWQQYFGTERLRQTCPTAGS